MRVLIVGEAPSRTGDTDAPLSGKCGVRLCKLMGMPGYDYPTLSAEFALTNLLGSQEPSSTGKGDAYDLPKAVLAARSMRHLLKTDHRLTVLLGKRVARAFLERTKLPPWYQTIWDHQHGHISPVVVVPHPSGISHYWNSRPNVKAATGWWTRLRELNLSADPVLTKLA